jgi:serine/threonine protein phosphatase PrpC
MESLSYYCQGESHKSSDKPCQDRAYDYHSPALSMAIICDGHGGERYFRSQYGAEFATKITQKSIRQFVKNIKKNEFKSQNGKLTFEGSPFTQYSAEISTIEQEEKPAHKALMWLFSSIIAQWNEAIAKHARGHDLDEWEKEHVEQKYQEQFLADKADKNATFEKTYGCTLMAYVRTDTYWLAFHIGDGKCVRFMEEGGKLHADQPIPWDKDCFLNKTTSLCSSDALAKFRYCYEGDGKFPVAMCLGSDGIDDTFGDGDKLTDFYIEIYKEIAKNGKRKAKAMLQHDLPVISQRGSKDDMSVAMVYDEFKLQYYFFLFSDYQELKYNEEKDVLENKIEKLSEKVDHYSAMDQSDRKIQIELQYAKNDLERAKAQVESIDRRIARLKEEFQEFKEKERKKKH